MHFSVVDIETTGFSHKLHDRVIEIAAIKTDTDGNVIDIFETLVNPNRDVGPTHIHGITSEMLAEAPTFADVANRLLDLIDETAIIAHNARFDTGFIGNEFELSGYQNIAWPYICTLELSREHLDDLPSKKLADLCRYFDIEHNDEHSALSDTEATLQVFQNIVREFDLKFSKDSVFRHSARTDNVDAEAKLLTRKSFQKSQQNYVSPLKRLIDRLPEVKTNIAGERQYLTLLDEILLDRIVTEVELIVLTKIALEYDVTQIEMLELNRKYLENLVKIYLNDGVVSETKMRDIDKVKKILMLENLNTNELIEKVSTEHEAEIGPAEKDCAGKTVCFTGQLQSARGGTSITRKIALEIATSKGLMIKKGVVKKLDYLVLADVHSQSNKAKKARQFGVTLIAENAFWSMLGVQVD